ncbi:MAG TPA: CHASE2 domain-containing protein [Vicinamibacterales bacterium]|nr:CHASE2 domain-containing protein [Vicinamibacterales bacterium]
MTVRPRALVMVSGLVPTIAATLLCLYRLPALANLEYSVYDVLTRMAPTRPPDRRIVIVDVDERSLSAIGQWPWRRDVVGRLISRLRDLGASTIALDIVFAESDRFQDGGADTDAALADTLRGGKVVLGYALTFEETAARASACVQHPIGLAVVRRGDDQADDPFFRATGSICSLPLLTQAAGASGFLNAAPDPDGLLRRVPLLLELDGQVYPALSLAAVVRAARPQDAALTVLNVNASSLALDGGRIPLDGKANLLVRYRGAKRTFPYVSAADVLNGLAPPRAFADKLVFVGTTALGTREVVATPLDTLFAGVEVQATVADNLLQQDFVRRPEFGVTLETQIVLALGLAAALLVARMGLLPASAAIAAGAVAIWAGSAWLLATRGVFLSPLFPTLGLGGALAAMTVARFAIEHRRADRAVSDRTTSQQLMVQSLLSLTEVRDAETGRHSRRTQRYTRVLAEQLATDPRYASYLTPENIVLLSSLAPLHDIGKVGVPDRLLNKPGALTSEELVEMRKHPAHGRDVITHAEQEVGVSDDLILAMAKDIVYTHHEKWDGTGYPEGLQGTEIPIPGRLIALVDVYDAVRTRRLYRQPMSHGEAVELIVRGKGTHFDPAVVDAFLTVSRVLEGLSSDGEPPVSS